MVSRKGVRQSVMNRSIFPWVVVVALRREVVPLRKLCRPNLVLLQTGMGCENADRTLRTFIREQPVSAVLGVGLAGALSSTLGIGDLVVGQEIRGPSLIVPPAAFAKVAQQMQANGLRIHLGTLVTQNQMACTAEGKRQLAASMGLTGAGCVDMESWAMARVCQESGIPYVIVRCISDIMGEDLPLDFNRFRRPDGNLDDRRIAISALMHPSCIRGLWKLARQLNFCTRKLAEFVNQFTLVDPTSALKE
jgi:adenosylhomocysteine nucleosidase